jgi:hypothetical protein
MREIKGSWYPQMERVLKVNILAIGTEHGFVLVRAVELDRYDGPPRALSAHEVESMRAHHWNTLNKSIRSAKETDLCMSRF